MNQSATKDITLHQTRYKFGAIDLDTQYKKGLPIEFTVCFSIKKSFVDECRIAP